MPEYDIFIMAGITIMSSAVTGTMVYLFTKRMSGDKSYDAIIKQNTKDFDTFRKSDKAFKKEVLEKFTQFRKQVELLQTVAFGIKAHSTPNYMYGLEQEADIDSKPGEGAFFEQSDEDKSKQKIDNDERMRIDDENTEYDKKLAEPKKTPKKKKVKN
jgi:hypothetical protein